MTVDRYWDEDGVLHIHDRNITTTAYECSNGHLYGEKTGSPCPVKSCTFFVCKPMERKELTPTEALAQT